MDEFLKQLPLSVSIIDYIGKMEDGVGLLISIVIEEQSYEIGYWYNRNGDVRLVPEKKLLEVLDVKSIYEYDKINELIYIIHNSIPNPDAILDEFLKEN